MGKTAEDLRHDLEQQRESIGRDLVAIGDRVSPGRMVERRRSAVRQSFGRARDAVMGARDTATNTAEHATSSAQAAVGNAASTVSDAVTSAPQAIQSQTQGNPLAAGLIAFGAGALAGSLLPTTRREQQAVAQVQPALESAVGELADSAQSVAATAKEQVAEGAEHLKDTAKEAAQSVKSEAQSATQSVQAQPGGSPSPEHPNRSGDGGFAPLDEAPDGRTQSDPNDPSGGSRPPGVG
jgi:uncharacterized protein YjbJ (UPF0337 family)